MNQFKVMDFVVNLNTDEVHIVTKCNDKQKSVFDLSNFVQIDGIEGIHPHYQNFRYATKDEVLKWVESKFSNSTI